ncbi:MAG: aldo/keto reductase [Planctomycetaceae bacterium]
MDTRLLPGTDLTVSRLCLGTMTFGAQVDERGASSMVNLCLAQGINFIDTANVYNGGASESILGQILRGQRDRVVLASKVGIRVGDSPKDQGLSRETIMYQIDESLRRLQTDHLDFYYLHQPDRATPLEESLAAMDELVRAGKVRYVACSNFAAWQVCRMQWLAESKGLAPLALTQPMHNLLARGVEREFFPMCRALGLATIAYNPLAGGLLTGKHSAVAPPATGTRFDRNETYQNRYWHAQNFDAVNRLSAAAKAEGRSLVSLALCWLLHHTPIDVVILGASTLQQLDQNLNAAAEGPCSEQTLTICEDVWQALRGIAPPYFRE